MTSGGLINIEETDIAAILVDEDDMTSDSATSIASQQSIKAYADAAPAAQMTPATTYANEESVTLANGFIIKANRTETTAGQTTDVEF